MTEPPAWPRHRKPLTGLRCRGQEVGSTGQFETVDLGVAYARENPISEELNKDFLVFRDIDAKLHDSDPTLSNAFTLDLINNVASAVT